MSTNATAASEQADFPTIFNPATCTRKGLCPVTVIRGQAGDPFESHSLYFEQHGNGPKKILLIMGLNSSSFSWWPQIKHFGPKSDYSVVAFDNRGVGNSGTPRGPYSTSGMAEDAIVLLDYLGWKDRRSIHVVGISLGGMIAQELAYRIPERIISLTLGVTKPGGRPLSNIPPWKGATTLAKLIAVTDPDVKIPMIHEMIFSRGWLDLKDEDEPSRTNRDVMTEDYRRRLEVTRPQTLIGTLSQMAAGMTHNVSNDRLRKISASIPKVLIVTGDEDHLVPVKNSKILKDNMPEAEYVQWEHCGHALHMQYRRKFNDLLERVFAEGKERLQGSPDKW